MWRINFKQKDESVILSTIKQYVSQSIKSVYILMMRGKFEFPCTLCRTVVAFELLLV